MTFVVVIVTRQGFTVGKAKPSLGPFQGLDMGLFVDTCER